MKKSIIAIVLSLLLCFSMTVGLLADADEQAMPDDQEIVSKQGESIIGKSLHIYILAGAVVGAMAVVAVLYRKKDESRYL